MIDLKVRWKGVEDMIHDLKVWNSKAVPFGVRNGLNKGAFEARRQWQGEIRRSFTLRNQYTVNSIRVDTAKGLDTRRMVATVGSIAPYMAKQEFGGKGSKAIPGPVAAGQAPGAKRTRVVRAGLRMSRLNVAKVRASNRRQFNAAAIAVAKRRGQKVALLHRPGGGKGLFQIAGTKKAPTTKLLYGVGHGSKRVPATPTLQRTLGRMDARMPRIFYDAILAELKRHRIAGY